MWLTTRCCFLSLCLGLCAPASLISQAVIGRTLDAESGRPVGGALIKLLRNESLVGRTLSTGDGSFRLQARPGRYKIQVERIGYREWLSDPFTVAGAEDTSLLLRLPVEAISLPELFATASNQCQPTPRMVPELGLLWNEALKSLESLEVLDTVRPHTFQVARETRMLDNPSLVPMDSSTYRTVHTGVLGAPFRAPEPDYLASEGYVSQGDAHYTFYGLDARTLVSPSFEATHCFRFASPTPEIPSDWVGVAFEPDRPDSKPDVSGVLWLDGQSAQLLRLQFRYVGGPGAPVDPNLGGNVEFERLDGGQVVVSAWTLRAPEVPPQAVAIAELAERSLSVDEYDIREDWGILTGIGSLEGELRTLRGTVTQNFGGQAVGLGGARVRVPNTPISTLTDRDGSFAIELGDHETSIVEVMPLAPASIFELPDQDFAVFACAMSSCELDVGDGFDRLAHDACPEEGPTFVFQGRVVSTDGKAITGAAVRTPTARRQTYSDAEGRFFLCADTSSVTTDFIAPGHVVTQRELSTGSGVLSDEDVILPRCEPLARRNLGAVTCVPNG